MPTHRHPVFSRCGVARLSDSGVGFDCVGRAVRLRAARLVPRTLSVHHSVGVLYVSVSRQGCFGCGLFCCGDSVWINFATVGKGFAATQIPGKNADILATCQTGRFLGPHVLKCHEPSEDKTEARQESGSARVATENILFSVVGVSGSAAAVAWAS